jgi:o-succinylbenzoate synthase
MRNVNRICTTKIKPYRLPLRQPWVSAKDTLAVRQGWWIFIGTEEGLAGFGDCAPLPCMGTEDLPQAQRQLQSALDTLLHSEPIKALSMLDNWQPFPATRCALETALIDLLARQSGVPLAKWLNRRACNSIKINAMIGSLDAEVETRAWLAYQEGFKLLKIKLGVKPWAHELDRLQKLALQLPEHILFRLDANGSWNKPEAYQIIAELKNLPVESLEEPLARPDARTLREMQSFVPWPLALDESLVHWPLDVLMRHPPVKRLVLKPMLLGGLLPSLKLAQRSVRAGMESVVTTTVDSAVGNWAALHLAAAIANESTHGLNTGCWITGDIFASPEPENGMLSLRHTPGLGFGPYPPSTDRVPS